MKITKPCIPARITLLDVYSSVSDKSTRKLKLFSLAFEMKPGKHRMDILKINIGASERMVESRRERRGICGFL